MAGLLDLAQTFVDIADQIRDPATLPDEVMAKAREEVTARLESRGLPADRAAAYAESAGQASTKLAESLIAAGKAAQDLLDISYEYEEVIRNNVSG